MLEMNNFVHMNFCLNECVSSGLIPRSGTAGSILNPYVTLLVNAKLPSIGVIPFYIPNSDI